MKLIESRQQDLGGFYVRRVLPVRDQRTVGPWIFLDHMGPAEFSSGEGINVRPHPHINLATVTYTFEGEIYHRDSLGNSEVIKPGEINLMVAGKGIVHSERTAPEKLESGQKLNGLQLWMALPEEFEEIEPAFYHYDAGEIPSVLLGSVPARVLIGEAYGVQSPVKTFCETLYVEARLKAGDKISLPNASESAVYVVNGAITIGEQEVDEHQMLVLEQSSDEALVAREDSFIAVIGGEKFGPRFIEWNFVSSRKERIEQAKLDWLNKKFPVVPGDEEEFIPLPDNK